MSTRTAARLAWLLAGLTVPLMVGAVFLVWLGRASPWRVDGQFSLASMVVGVLSNVPVPIIGALIAARQPRNPYGWLWLASGFALSFTQLVAAYAFHMLPPLMIGIAILRYRLYDIDLIIRRTLVYSLLTLALGLIYIGCIVLSRTLVAPLIGGSEVAIVASTLVIAALFNPLRRRIQNLIDKRFYRRKYDATKVLAAFGATARDETDLERLTAEMLCGGRDDAARVRWVVAKRDRCGQHATCRSNRLNTATIRR